MSHREDFYCAAKPGFGIGFPPGMRMVDSFLSLRRDQFRGGCPGWPFCDFGEKAKITRAGAEFSLKFQSPHAGFSLGYIDIKRKRAASHDAALTFARYIRQRG